MKKLRVDFNRRRWWFTIIVVRADMKKIRKGSMKVDVLFDLGFGWGLVANRISFDKNGNPKKRLFFRFGMPKFGIEEMDYESTIKLIL